MEAAMDKMDNHPRMCVLSTLCGNVDKHSPFDIFSQQCCWLSTLLSTTCILVQNHHGAEEFQLLDEQNGCLHDVRDASLVCESNMTWVWTFFSTIIAIIRACACWALFVVTLTNTIHLIYIYIYIICSIPQLMHTHTRIYIYIYYWTVMWSGIQLFENSIHPVYCIL